MWSLSLLNTEKNFSKFFSTFRPTFHSKTDVAAESVYILEQLEKTLQEKYPNIKNNMYLSATKFYPTEEYLEKVKKKEQPNGEKSFKNQEKDSTQSWPFDYIDYYIATIKIVVAGKSGVILLEPGVSQPKPQVIMKDCDSDKRVDSHQVLRFSILPENNQYIYATSLDDHHKEVEQLIYIGNPYCSMLDTTGRYNILTRMKFVYKRDSSGCVIAGVVYYISQELWETKVHQPYLEQKSKEEKDDLEWPSVIVFNYNGKKRKDWYITLNKYCEQDEYYKKFAPFVREIEAIMELTPDILDEILCAHADILNNQKFLNSVLDTPIPNYAGAREIPRVPDRSMNNDEQDFQQLSWSLQKLVNKTNGRIPGLSF